MRSPGETVDSKSAHPKPLTLARGTFNRYCLQSCLLSLRWYPSFIVSRLRNRSRACLPSCSTKGRRPVRSNQGNASESNRRKRGKSGGGGRRR